MRAAGSRPEKRPPSAVQRSLADHSATDAEGHGHGNASGGAVMGAHRGNDWWSDEGGAELRIRLGECVLRLRASAA